MLTLKNDLIDSSYTRSDLCIFTVYILLHQRLMKNISAIMGLHIYGITEKLYAINFLNVIDACRLVPGRLPSWFRLF